MSLLLIIALKFNLHCNIIIQRSQNSEPLTEYPKVSKQIWVGDWCLFDWKERFLVVHVLGFSYLKCKTYREREYSREFADIKPSEPTVGNKKTVGVLCSYYGWSKEGLLTEVNGQPCYVNIATLFF